MGEENYQESPVHGKEKPVVYRIIKYKHNLFTLYHKNGLVKASSI